MRYHIPCMTDNVVVAFQNCFNLLELVPGSYSETCYNGNQVINIKVEEVTDIQEEENPVPETFPAIKAEHEVSCKSVCLLLGTFHTYPVLLIFFFVPYVCHPHELASLL
jgi:hypothetical protein